MDINLCYVHGISRVDTPYFPTLRNQEDYFDSHEIVTVETTFYPPHYTNVIRFDINDVSLLQNINYLYFLYSGKRYYYFIDSIDYVSETLIDLHITLDVIQTYMFNINFSNGIIERKFINRWDSNNKINRDYLRENVSDGLFTNQKTTLFNRDLWLVIKVSMLPDSWDISSKVTINNKDSYIPYGYCYLPLFCNKLRYKRLSANAQSEEEITVNIDFTKIVPVLKDSRILDAYIIDYKPHSNIVINYSNDDIICEVFSYKKPWNDDLYLEGYHKYIKLFYDYFVCFIDYVYRYDATRMISNVSSRLYSINLTTVDTDLYFLKNITVSNDFNLRFMPQLLDENYMRIEFGNGGGNTSYPLYNIKDLSTIKLYEYYNCDDGSKIFTINETDKTLTDGLDYMTYAYSNLVPSVTLLNDAWSSYVANNRSRWASAGIGTVKNAVTAFINIPNENKYLDEKIASLNSNPNRFDKRYKVPTMKESFSRKINSYENKKENLFTSGITGAMESVTPLLSQGLRDYNAYYAPDSIRQSGDFISGYTSVQLLTFYRRLVVNDYEKCGQYFHRNGYKVDEYVSYISNPFQYVQNRYYFNVLKIKDADIHLDNYIENYDLIESITDRLKDGIRLWNVLNNNVILGSFIYDNVELDYLS